MNYKFCTRCGGQLSPRSQICMNCGPDPSAPRFRFNLSEYLGPAIKLGLVLIVIGGVWWGYARYEEKQERKRKEIAAEEERRERERREEREAESRRREEQRVAEEERRKREEDRRRQENEERRDRELRRQLAEKERLQAAAEEERKRREAAEQARKKRLEEEAERKRLEKELADERAQLELLDRIQKTRETPAYRDKVKLAGRGDAGAMFDLGEIMGPLDAKESAEWYGKARQQAQLVVEQMNVLIKQDDLVVNAAERDMKKREEDFNKAEELARQWAGYMGGGGINAPPGAGVQGGGTDFRRADVRDIVAKHRAAANTAKYQFDNSKVKWQRAVERLNENKNRREAHGRIVTKVDEKQAALLKGGE